MTSIPLIRPVVYAAFVAGAVVMASDAAKAYDCLDYCTTSCTSATVTVPESRACLHYCLRDVCTRDDIGRSSGFDAVSQIRMRERLRALQLDLNRSVKRPRLDI
jgi:hypothetical protein